MENSGNFQANLIGSSPTMFHSLKGSPDSLLAQSGGLGGLARYHSAPSSTFAALLEPDFYSANDSAELVQFLTQNGLSELAGFGDAGISSLKSSTKQGTCIKKEQSQQVYSNQNDVLGRHSGSRVASSFPDHIGQGRLSAILEHAGEEGLVSQPCQQNPTVSSLQKPFLDTNIHFKSNLIRHSSLPSDFLSRLAMEDMSERPTTSQQMGSHVQAISQQMGSHIQTTSQQVGSHMQTASPRTSDNTAGKVYLVTSRMSPRGVPVRKCLADEVGPCKEEDFSILDNELNQHGLLRQSSSPAGLLSQLSLDEFANSTDKMTMSSTQGLVHLGWDEAAMDSKIATLGQRKRGREVDGRLLKSLPVADLPISSLDQIMCPPSNHYGVGSSSGDSMVTDSVLCKLRAKRGCATHPRSIAERVRRMKISERMKKLQDLVPNLDKQAHTADMLDEVVEYVKLLQRQVEELSKHSHECNAMCQNKGDNSDKN